MRIEGFVMACDSGVSTAPAVSRPAGLSRPRATWPRRGLLGCLACLTLSALCLSPVSRAQSVEFRPELFLDQAYNSNLLTSAEGVETSDHVTEVGVALPISRAWRAGTVSFLYEPSYQWYRDNDALNHDEHRAALDLTAETSRRASLTYGLEFSRTQDQGSVEEADAGGFTLVPRSERDRLVTDLLVEREIGRRAGWHGGLGAARIEHTLVEDPGEDPFLGGLEDRSEYGALFGMDRAVSRIDRVGGEVLYDLYDLEETGEEKVGQLLLTWDRSVPERYDVTARIGAYRRDKDPAAVSEPPDADRETGLSFLFSVARSLRRSSLGFSASRAPSAGGSLAGTSTNTAARLFWTGTPNPRWVWTLHSTYTLREPTLAGSAETTTLGGLGRVDWRPSQRFGFRVEVAHTKRSADDPGYDTSVTIARFGLRWHPKGPATPGGAGR